jgi:hypothetical protein
VLWRGAPFDGAGLVQSEGHCTLRAGCGDEAGPEEGEGDAEDGCFEEELAGCGKAQRERGSLDPETFDQELTDAAVDEEEDETESGCAWQEASA